MNPGQSSGRFGAVVVTFVALLSLWLWATHGTEVQRAICPRPVTAAGHTLSCDGGTVVQRPDGSLAVIPTSPPVTAATARR